MFRIHLTEEVVPETDPGVTAVYGKIQIGQYSETFIASLVTWDASAYRQHWRLALRRLLDGADRSALITSYVAPQLASHLIWWPLYRDGDIVHAQNQLLFYNQLATPFSEENPWASIAARKVVNEQGLPISEWATDIRSVGTFLNGELG